MSVLLQSHFRASGLNLPFPISAIKKLNSCQSGFAKLHARRMQGLSDPALHLGQMRDWLRRIGYQPSDLDRLNIVHVAGAKGKGSTRAYIDSILNEYRKTLGKPSKVGLFTSPHLVCTRERIRINSEPITEEQFCKYFFQVWDLLERTAREEGLDPAFKPNYFRMLTLLSFHVFIQEGVDMAIYEVGVGGEYDTTNIIERPVAASITALDIDHVPTLALSVRQVDKAEIVLLHRAAEKSAELNWIELHPALETMAIKPAEKFQYNNASLAIALAVEALQRFGISVQRKESQTGSASYADLPAEFVPGLGNMKWRGRCEVIRLEKQHYYLDGAHTQDSFQVACSWFSKLPSNSKHKRVLMFNQQSTRDYIGLLRTVFRLLTNKGIYIAKVIFCTGMTYKNRDYKRDFVNKNANPKALETLELQKELQGEWLRLDPSADVAVLPTIENAIDCVQGLSGEKVSLTCS
ncbi:folylpolyglutamate synthase [Bimuria novae-zelandiae CBS 107.79]|uniref:tetrahydrofolate synthase n=1 Tax=Bimuria novae-zelandiae CBS 107.79 TaxID=1447943 RepID=A0A6A5UP07_9PLEO|nr:folylpolyglutamate synthase [Bimuria novae-zelandiae CBS 107.79]